MKGELSVTQTRVEPGHWIIGGYTVMARRRRGRTIGWTVMDPAPEGNWPPLFTYLADVVEWVLDHPKQGTDQAK